MKRTHFVVLVLVSFLAATVWAEPTKQIKAGWGVTGVGQVGKPMAETLKTLGPPDKKVTQGGKDFHVYGESLVVVGNENVFMIQVMDQSGATVSGLKVGATKAEVIEAEGEDYKLYSKGKNTAYQLIYPKGVSFAFDDKDVLVAISVIESF